MPAFDPVAIRRLLLDMAQQRSVEEVIDLVVTRLAAQDAVALARVWLLRPGDICDECLLRTECGDRTACLHLVASAGGPLDPTKPPWTAVGGDFRRFPLGVRKVGRIVADGEPVEVADARRDSSWAVRADWIEAEGIRGFGGQPLVYRGERLGVLAVFARSTMTGECLTWLRMVADHVATAIANTQAFEEIQRLQQQLALENDYLREEIRTSHGFGDIVGDSPALRKVLTQVELVAPADSTVLISGESGTGKELIARAIHERSRRKQRPLVKVNCASIPRELFESEFFGHVKGAFTGAVRDRVGRFQLANGGTLFLDEVGEIPLELQGKLLRVIQEGTFERVGEDSTRTVDVRLIAATNRNLAREAEAGRFREDLYYRLSVFPIEVVPLRDRRDDLPLLAEHFIEEGCRRLGVSRPTVKRRQMLALKSHDWPGNVRELQNVIERALIRSQSGPFELDLSGERPAAVQTVAAVSAAGPRVIQTYEQLRELERENLKAALEACRWRVSGPYGAAKLLGLKPTTLASKIKALGLREQVR